MSHECDDCGEEFETLSSLRLHDCGSSEGGAFSPPERMEDVVEELEELLDEVCADEGFGALHTAVATYEKELASAHASDGSDRYRGVSAKYEERLVEALEEAALSEGWGFFEEFLDAYHPEASDGLPHATPVLENVAGRHAVRARLTDPEGAGAVRLSALEYFEAVRNEVEDGQDLINEGLHPYGWGIGHPEFGVDDRIHEHASVDIFTTSAMLEHAFYADQHAAVELLERIADDDSVEETVRTREGEMDETRYLLDAPAGAASGFAPSVPRYWDWQEELGYSFEMDEEVEERVRRIVRREGIDEDLSEGWEITDLLV